MPNIRKEQTVLNTLNLNPCQFGIKKRQTHQASRHDGFDHFYFSLIMYILGLLSSGDYVLSGDENGDLNLLDLYTLRVSELSI